MERFTKPTIEYSTLYQPFTSLDLDKIFVKLARRSLVPINLEINATPNKLDLVINFCMDKGIKGKSKTDSIRVEG